MGLLKHPVIAFLKLVRIENLFIIAFTLYAIGYNFFNLNLRHPFHLNEFLTGMLMISTVLIAAAGTLRLRQVRWCGDSLCR